MTDKEQIKKEIDDIERTFKTTGELTDYQERMVTQVFIDIRNQVIPALDKAEKEKQELKKKCKKLSDDSYYWYKKY